MNPHLTPVLDLWARLEHREDLIYFDGPLLSIFEDPQGTEPERFFFVSWCGVDDNGRDLNRWIAFPVSIGNKQAYMDGKMSLLALIEAQPELIDLYPGDHHQKPAFITLIPTAALPDDLRPTPDSYFTESLRG